MNWKLVLAACFISIAALVSPAQAQAQAQAQALVKGTTPLMEAVRHGQLAQVKKRARKSNVNGINTVGDSALLLAVSLDNLANAAAMVELLLRAGADLNLVGSLGQSAPEIAVDKNNAPVLRALLQKQKNWVHKRAADGSTLLIQAAKLGHTDVIKVLLQFGAKKTDQDGQGLTARDHALRLKLKDTASLL